MTGKILVTGATGNIGAVAVEVDYGAPSVRDRAVWGELVPYGKVWRAGANENTTISFDKDVTVGGQKVPAGKYGLFLIPTVRESVKTRFTDGSDDTGRAGVKSSPFIRIKEMIGESREY